MPRARAPVVDQASRDGGGEQGDEGDGPGHRCGRGDQCDREQQQHHPRTVDAHAQGTRMVIADRQRREHPAEQRHADRDDRDADAEDREVVAAHVGDAADGPVQRGLRLSHVGAREQPGDRRSADVRQSDADEHEPDPVQSLPPRGGPDDDGHERRAAERRERNEHTADAEDQQGARPHRGSRRPRCPGCRGWPADSAASTGRRRRRARTRHRRAARRGSGAGATGTRRTGRSDRRTRAGPRARDRA